jgi:hypothetical protein
MTPLSYTREETYARMAKKRVQLKGSVVIGLVLSVIAIVLLLVLFIIWKRRQEVNTRETIRAITPSQNSLQAMTNMYSTFKSGRSR